MDLETAAAVLGVHYQTAYRLVRNGVLPAVRVGHGYDVTPEDVERVRRQREHRLPHAGAGVNWSEEHQQLAVALLRGEEATAREQLQRLQGQGATTVDLCEKLISPALKRLDAQRAAMMALGAEVMTAAELCERLVGTIASPLPGRPRGLAVVASPVGEAHRLPSLMATAALRESRWRVQHLGSGVPARDLAEFVEETEPTLVVISLTVASEAAEHFRRSLVASTSVPVVAGGSGERLSDLLDRVDAALGPKRAARSPGMGIGAGRGRR